MEDSINLDIDPYTGPPIDLEKDMPLFDDEGYMSDDYLKQIMKNNIAQLKHVPLSRIIKMGPMGHAINRRVTTSKI